MRFPVSFFKKTEKNSVPNSAEETVKIDGQKQRKNDKIVCACFAVFFIIAIVLNIFASPKEKSPQDVFTGQEENEAKLAQVLDRTANVKTLAVDEPRINQPSIYGHEILFSAGKGSLEGSVLTNLYLFDAQTGQAKKIAESKIKDGEIYETYLSRDWIVWLDTDHKGKNVIYKMNRNDYGSVKANTASIVQETANHMPKLGLYGNYLIWMEQESDTLDKLYFVDLTSDENMTIQEFNKTNYAVSSPFIYKNTVIWADSDPNDADGQNSAICSVVFDQLGTVDSQGDYVPDSDEGEIDIKTFSTGTYVHNPICNDDIFVWIDKNNAPDSSLYYAYKSGDTTPKRYWRNVTQYALGEDFLAFTSNQVIYAYYYQSDVLVQISPSGESSILPQASGKLVVWEQFAQGNDTFKYNILG